ncbi:MAG: molybdopterin-dependent oxidoreductase, partial [Anaerolineales bacterium]|nr:molybdopterin-dependent oxidoreductase [Anaerolineales bacterium]
LTADIPEDMEPSLEEMATYDPANFTFPNSAHICMVELDKDTCEVKITHYTAVDDVGSIINPLVVEGQVQGGIVQGVGQALLEHGVYDDNGQLLSGTMLDYAMPRADNMPMTNLANTVTPSPHNPLGVKGAGEMGTIAATVTVANAVMDALAPAGITHLDMPLTAQKLHAALNSNGGGD